MNEKWDVQKNILNDETDDHELVYKNEFETDEVHLMLLLLLEIWKKKKKRNELKSVWAL